MSKDPLRASAGHAPAREQVMKPVLDRSDSGVKSRVSCGTRRVRSMLMANLAVLICAVIISGTMIFALSSLPAKTEAYTTRGPIIIVGDGQFTPANGVVSGSGAPADPYIISGWQITVASGTGIAISETTSYFMIVDVQINGTAASAGSVTGISFFAVEHGQIKDSRINDTGRAIDLQWSYDCSVHGNEIMNTVGWAMSIQNCNRMHVVDNYFFGQNGVQAVSWSYSNVMLNEFLSNEMCISALDVNTLIVKENVATSCGHPVSLSIATNVQVLNNLFVDCMYGIEFSDVTYSDIRGNLIERASATGIVISSSSSVIAVSDNTVNGTGAYGGITLGSSWDIVVTRNMIANNTNGYGYTGGGMLLLTGCSNVLIFNNSLVDNMPQQAEDRNGPAVRWNGTYPVGGNYWSDYTGVDLMNGAYQDIVGPDGFGDTPLIIDGDSADRYPLMAPVPATARPVAEFTFDPVLVDVTMSVNFDASPSHHPSPAKNITGYRWDFDCDGTFDTSWSSTPLTSRMFPVPGVYTVVLEVEDEEGMTDMITHSITILEEGIIPEFGTVLAPALAVVVIVVFAMRRRTPSC